MSLYNVQRHAEQDPEGYIGSGWKKLRAALLRAFNREREMIRLRVAMGMMSEARQSDAEEYRRTFDECRELAERVRHLEIERDAWRSSGAVDVRGKG